MSYTIVLPSIVQPITDACTETLAPELAANLLVVENTVTNRGVARSWNEGVDWARTVGSNWLVIMSAGCRFGPPGGADFIAELTDGRDIVEAWYVGWHLIAFRLTLFAAVGVFDENFHPAYWEDNDFGRRLALSGVPIPWAKPKVDVWLSDFAHGVKHGNVIVDAAVLAAYYERKWGGPPSAERFDTPYDSGRPLSYWEPR